MGQYVLPAWAPLSNTMASPPHSSAGSRSSPGTSPTCCIWQRAYRAGGSSQSSTPSAGGANPTVEAASTG